MKSVGVITLVFVDRPREAVMLEVVEIVGTEALACSALTFL